MLKKSHDMRLGRHHEVVASSFTKRNIVFSNHVDKK